MPTDSSGLPSVRIYGPSRGAGSFQAITEGCVEALRELGVAHGFFPYDQSPDEEGFGPEVGPGNAQVALLFGQPHYAHLMRLHTAHRWAFAMIAPNGYGVDHSVVEHCIRNKVAFLSPSVWGAEILRAQSKRPCGVFPHGVRKAFDPALRPTQGGPSGRSEPGLYALHITSTASDRKGTRALLRAWVAARRDGASLGWLTVRSDPVIGRLVEQSLVRDVLTPMGLTPEQAGVIFQEKHVPAALMPDLYRAYDVVLQPSRAEGFGLCGLESVVAGTPVLLTVGPIGHMEYVRDLGRHAYGFELGPRMRMDDESDDQHELDEPALAEGLANLARCRLERPSLEERQALYDRWSWTTVTRTWLETFRQ